MSEMIARVAAAGGVSAASAEKGFALVADFIAKHGPPEQVERLFAAMPEARAAADAVDTLAPAGLMARAAAKIAGGNPVIALGTRLIGSGIGVPAIRPFGEALLGIARERAGMEVMGPIEAALGDRVRAALAFGKA